MNQDEIEEKLGITRCARCGHRLDGEIECPFCSLFPDQPGKNGLSKWVYITACFLTSPLSLYAIIKTDRMNITEKLLSLSGCLIWLCCCLLYFK
ncbi:MAG: hypothetical protein A2Y97_06815 [Nitrospirae bacterium RBG_13_39_12]|nr:MAG: hypothetical protein A2Y97_06815 [Nitrospirae bacterium RBG_13_39_12]